MIVVFFFFFVLFLFVASHVSAGLGWAGLGGFGSMGGFVSTRVRFFAV